MKTINYDDNDGYDDDGYDYKNFMDIPDAPNWQKKNSGNGIFKRFFKWLFHGFTKILKSILKFFLKIIIIAVIIIILGYFLYWKFPAVKSSIDSVKGIFFGNPSEISAQELDKKRQELLTEKEKILTEDVKIEKHITQQKAKVSLNVSQIDGEAVLSSPNHWTDTLKSNVAFKTTILIAADKKQYTRDNAEKVLSIMVDFNDFEVGNLEYIEIIWDKSQMSLWNMGRAAYGELANNELSKREAYIQQDGTKKLKEAIKADKALMNEAYNSYLKEEIKDAYNDGLKSIIINGKKEDLTDNEKIKKLLSEPLDTKSFSGGLINID